MVLPLVIQRIPLPVRPREASDPSGSFETGLTYHFGVDQEYGGLDILHVAQWGRRYVFGLVLSKRRDSVSVA